MAKFQVVFRSGERQDYDDVLEAAKRYWHEVWNVEGLYIPELYRRNEDGIIVQRLTTEWTEIAQPLEISAKLNTRVGTKTHFPDNYKEFSLSALK